MEIRDGGGGVLTRAVGLGGWRGSPQLPGTGAAPAALRAAERGPVRMAFGEDGEGCRGAVLSPPGLGAVTSAGLACSDGPVPVRQAPSARGSLGWWNRPPARSPLYVKDSW